MPKMKQHSGAKKRFRRTATGKIKVRRSNRNHILAKKDTGMKRKHRKMGLLCKANQKQVDQMIGG